MMHIFKYAAIAGLMAAIVQPTGAADENLSQTFSICMDQAGGVTQSMIECMDSETERQDVLLNKAYKEVIVGLSSERKQQLQKVQRLWLTYRKANCDFYYDPDGGTLARVSANDCFMSATAARAKELEGFSQQN